MNINGHIFSFRLPRARNLLSPSLQLKRSSDRRHALSPLHIRLSVRLPLHLHLWLPVPRIWTLKEQVGFVFCFLEKKKNRERERESERDRGVKASRNHEN